MKWSKLKHKYKTEFLHESVRERVDFHFDVYRKSHDQASEVLRVAIDGETVFKADAYRFERREEELARHYRQEHPGHGWREAYAFAEPLLNAEALHPRYKLTEAMRDIMILPIEAALQHEDPLICALALLDKRVGRRKLVGMKLDADAHPLIRLFYELRNDTKQPQLSQAIG